MELPESWFFKFPLEQLVTPQSFPNLRDITFHGDSVAYQWHNFRAFTKTPALSSATILGFRYYYWSRISPPSPPLTHLNVSLPPECIYEVLRETSNVIECRIFCFDTEPSDDDYFNNSLPLLTLPHLSSLYIAGSSDGKTLLNLIQTPALQSFSCLLRFSFYPGTANLFDFLVGTPTTKLTTSECLLPAVHDFDSKSKNLRELRIEDWSEPVDAVLEDDGLRSLETLIIRLDKDPNLQFHDDLLLNLIASRMPGNIEPGADIAQIKFVTFVADAGARLSDESCQQLEEMQKEGLEVVFVETEVPWVWSSNTVYTRAAEQLEGELRDNIMRRSFIPGY